MTPTTRARLLAGLLTVTGTTHFVAPRPYARIVPRGIGSRYGWVYVSGAAELACAAGLLPTRTRRAAALSTAALFVVVYPANVQMALDSRRVPSAAYRVGSWLRLPVQLPLVLWARRVAREAQRSTR